MILTRAWLNEWIDLKEISSQDICNTLNATGLEVDSFYTIKIPKDVVVGKVLTCKRHPDADKLSVCEVDLGSEVKQIVCGAKNVRANQYVVVSKVGAVLSSGMRIKETKLRGLDSSGMICSSEEIGLPPMCDGIMVLDDSIGELVLGKEFSEYELVHDDVIEVELTPNRGDCLSIHGIARDLSVSYDLDLNEFSSVDSDNQLGVGRALSISANEKIDATLLYRICQKEKIKSSFLIDLRLAIAHNYKPTALERVMEYAIYTTGVLLRAYSYSSFPSLDDKATIKIKKCANGLNAVYDKNSKIASYIGVLQKKTSEAKKEDKKVIFEASYSCPEAISINSANKKLESDHHLYRSSRGSEPDLVFGMDYLIELLRKYSHIMLYAGFQQVTQDSDEVRIPVDLSLLADIIGEEIPKDRVIQILKRLGFDVIFKSEQSVINVVVPLHRHDIVNIQDVCEEIVRIVGIDNIASKPLVFAEKDRMNDAYCSFQKRKLYRYRSVGVGFFETLHFVFDHRQRVCEYGLETIYKKLELTNPITNELDTLRSSLIPNLLESVARNAKFDKKSIKLFEIGVVFDKNRDESTKIAFVFSGEIESQKVANHGKPKEIGFFKFADEVSRVVGSFELEVSTCKDKLNSPYEYARVMLQGVDVGYISRVHLGVEKKLDLSRTYVCELDMSALPYERKEAIAYSKFPESIRDLSLMVPKDMSFSKLKKYICSTAPKEMIKLYPIDIYEDESFGDRISLTIKLHFRSVEKTLEDEEIVSMIEDIIKSVQEKFGIAVR